MGATSKETAGTIATSRFTTCSRYRIGTNLGCSPETSKMLRKPFSTKYCASRSTSSGERVTRKIGLSREKPQYWQLLIHSLDRYSGANRRIVLPKKRRVIVSDRRASSASFKSSIGSSKVANCAIFRLLERRGERSSCAKVILSTSVWRRRLFSYPADDLFRL